MTVRDFSELYLDGYASVEIWDLEKEKAVFDGTFYEAQECEYADEEVGSFEIDDGIIVINI